ncbi:MAG TPA: hypothetical protein VN809_16685 [Telmatospirillum sp.]|nr:hypothetical protein [Telmatospirillum sp.]
MTLKSIGVAGIVLGLMFACGPAQAFPDDSDHDGASVRERRDGPSDHPRADYRYSGNGFNFSMSRNVTQPNGESSSQDQDTEQTPPQRSKPGFFQRIIRDVFGD